MVLDETLEPTRREHGWCIPETAALDAAVLLASPAPVRVWALAEALLGVGVSPQLADSRAQLLALADRRSADGAIIDLDLDRSDPGGLPQEVHDRGGCPVVALGWGRAPVGAVAVLPVDMPAEQLAHVAVGAMGRAREDPAPLSFGALTLELRTHECFWDGQPVELTRDQRLLMRALIEARGAAVSGAELALALHPAPSPGDAEALRAQVHRVRRRLEHASPNAKGFIVTVNGCGYRLAPPGAPPADPGARCGTVTKRCGTVTDL